MNPFFGKSHSKEVDSLISELTGGHNQTVTVSIRLQYGHYASITDMTADNLEVRPKRIKVDPQMCRSASKVCHHVVHLF
jgi:hypothetical protein